MAIDFNGSTDRIDYANVANPIGGNSTWAFWIRFDAFSVSYNFTAHQSGDAAYSILFNSLVSRTYFQVIVAGGTSLFRQTDDVLTTGWNHVAITWDGSTTAANMHIFVNGVEPSYNITTNGASLAACTGTWSLGGRKYDDTRCFDGQLAEWAYWSRILAAGEREMLADGFSPAFIPNGLKFYAPLIRGANDRLGKTATLDGTSAYAHPRIIQPGRRGRRVYTYAAAAGGNRRRRLLLGACA